VTGPSTAPPAAAAPAAAITLTADEARRLALHAQGLIGAPPKRTGVAQVLDQLGAVQLDTISVLARSHELVPYARLGAVGRPAVEAAYWTHGPHGASTFEYWAHAACLLPVAEWGTFGWRRRAYRERDRDFWRVATPEATKNVLARIAAEGPMTATELGGAKKGGEWWDWSDTKVSVEKLLATGDVVCVARRGWKRIYDLPERALPSAVLAVPEPDRDTAHRRLVTLAGRALGVATRADLADYYRLKLDEVDAALPATGLVPVRVAGWAGRGRRDEPMAAWADPDALALLSAGGPRGRHRTTLLSPFDSLVWERRRTARVFGFEHRLEAYVPRQRRVHGYFVMPLLAGGKLLGRVDPARDGGTLIARQVSLDTPRAVEPMAAALIEAAGWVGCDAVRVERVNPPELAAPLRAACG
jgi:uncharacterized protein YcaQ